MAEALRHTTFELRPRDGDTIRGDVRKGAEGTPSEPLASVVVVVHGFKGFKDWGFFPWVCERLAEAGHTVVSFNFSRNGVGEDLLDFSQLDAFGSNTLSLEQDELRLVLRHVLDGGLLAGVPRRVGLLGHSRGGGQAVLAAAGEPGVDALVTWSAVATFDRWTDEVKRNWRRDGRIWITNQRTGQQMPLDVSLLDDLETHHRELDILRAARSVSVPWLVLHGKDDETVDLRDGILLADAGARAEAHWVPGAGHTFGARHPFEGPTPALLDALDATVAHFAQTLRL